MKKKPTKYFLLQEKQKQKKQITISEDELGKSLTTNSTILKECTNYFQKIYTKQKTCATTQNILLKHKSHKTTNEQNHKLTTKKKKKKKIEINEIREAIQSMENGKSPGEDGIP